MDEEPQTDKEANPQQAIEGRPVAKWAANFLDYLSLKARLVAVESKEATTHFIGLLVLLGAGLVLALSSVLMFGAFLLYVVARLLRLDWGWSALICGAILALSSLVALVLLRLRLRKPVFQTTLRDFEKDREWLTRSTTRVT